MVEADIRTAPMAGLSVIPAQASPPAASGCRLSEGAVPDCRGAIDNVVVSGPVDRYVANPLRSGTEQSVGVELTQYVG